MHFICINKSKDWYYTSFYKKWIILKMAIGNIFIHFFLIFIFIYFFNNRVDRYKLLDKENIYDFKLIRVLNLIKS